MKLYINLTLGLGFGFNLGLETSNQTPDDFIQTAVKLKQQLQMTSNFAERKFRMCRAHVLNSKLQAFIDLKLCRTEYFTERVW